MKKPACEGLATMLPWLKIARQVVRAAVLVSMALRVSGVAAQSEPEAPDDRGGAVAEPVEEITVIGHRFLRDLRIEVQASRERVYGLFNSLNSNEEFDIYCHDGARTGTRIVRRVCRPQFVDDATAEAGKWYLIALKGGPGGGVLAAQAEMAVVPLKEQQLAAEVQRLTRESREFRRAITEYQALERRYEDARRAVAIEASVSVIDTGRALPSDNSPRRGAIYPPEPVELVMPKAVPSREGWVKLRYSVLADGRTSEVRAIDSMPPWLDPADAIAAAEKWSFVPATDGGAPIDWHSNLAIISFGRPHAEYGGSIEFAEAYEEVAQLITSGRLEDARSRNEQNQRVYAETLEEVQLAQLQLAAIEHALGRPHTALVAIRRATEPGVAGLADEERKLALEHRFALERELGYAADALRTYERRDKLERLPAREPLAQQALALEQALMGADASQAVQVRIGESGQWEHPLNWNAFEVSDANGVAESVGVECSRNKAELPFRSNMQTTIPASWGGCVLTIRGQPETTLTLYEFP